jgi:tetrahydromethanopterin S-methyltransferase subunit A
MSEFIRDGKGKLIGQIIENGNVTYIRDGTGHLKGQHIKSVDKTFDAKGRFVGHGDQLLRLLN